MNGYEIARRLGESGCDVLLSPGSARPRIASAGFDHHFVKPVDPQALERLIESVC